MLNKYGTSSLAGISKYAKKEVEKENNNVSKQEGGKGEKKLNSTRI